MAYLDPLVNGVKCITHNLPLLQSSLESTWLFQRHPLHQRAECFKSQVVVIPQRLEASIMLKQNEWIFDASEEKSQRYCSMRSYK